MSSDDDLAADALRRATRSTSPRKASSRTASGRSATSTGGGAGRDPQLVSRAVEDLLAERGWKDDSAIAVMMARWEELVGPDLAGHVQPTGFADGTLTLTAESTAWATQVRLLTDRIQQIIATAVGPGVVRSIVVMGPAAPSWVAGPRRVKGRGPRDTYG